MENERVLAFTLASEIDTAELDDVSGGKGVITIPTVRVSGGPFYPDITEDRYPT